MLNFMSILNLSNLYTSFGNMMEINPSFQNQKSTFYYQHFVHKLYKEFLSTVTAA
jgi:hypothetical protein